MGRMSEETPLPTSLFLTLTARQNAHTGERRVFLFSIAASLYVLLRYCFLPLYAPSLWPIDNTTFERQNHCRQAEPLLPSSFDVNSLVLGEERQIVDWLSGAVKIPTEIFDVMGDVGEDPRWEVFYRFAEYLQEAFPLV